MYTLKELESIVNGCHGCPLCETRNNVVFGDGDPESDIMFISEGPGYNEDKAGHTFLGRSGELFDKS